MKNKNLFFLILLIWGNMMAFAQDCSINAGGNATICGTSYTLQGSAAGNTNGIPTWTLVSKPAGAPNPVINGANTYTPNITGMTSPGSYVFSVSQPCTTGTVTSQVTIIAPGDTSTFTAGSDITNISAITGTATLSGVVPPGYTASWTYYNIYNYENYSQITTNNATMSNTTTATPTLSLIKKADHNFDPSYRAVLRITSVNNPNCWYEDDAIVRFIPNPQISLPTTYSSCSSSSTEIYRPIGLNSTSPMFSTKTPNSSGNPAFGTTITLNPISQPAGGNISFYTLENSSMYFQGINVVGVYKFTITVSNANGSYTTPVITYTHNGIQPSYVNFIDSAHPEQMMSYSSGGSGMAVYCNKAGNTAPITVYFKIDPSNSPTVTNTVTSNGIIPPGGSATVSTVSGTGTYNRSFVVTPPTGGWRVGTYRFSVVTSAGTCSSSQVYYIHISDGNRSNVNVPNMTVCYPGSGVVSATVPLPAIYKGVVNTSYFQDFSGGYDFTLVSKPVGAANPTYEATNLRTFTNTSSVISNLNKPGEYVFKIKAVAQAGGVDPNFLAREYACSGTSLEGTFSIFVSAQVNANAGSDKTFSCTTATTLDGNDPGAASNGQWTLVSKPAGAPDPVITNSSLYNTAVNGFSTFGVYKFSWKVSTGTCISADEVTITFNPCTSCYKPGATGVNALSTKFGITSLGRAGTHNTDNWPMVRKGGWIAMESKTKGFVPNRVAFNASGNPVGIPVGNFIEGMMVYDTTNMCLKLYTSKDGGALSWYCISTQTCPD